MTDLIKSLPENINITVNKADLIAFAHEIIKEAQLSNVQITNIPQSAKSLLTIDEASKFVGLATRTLYKKTSMGEIPHYKKAGKLYFKVDELTTWLTDTKGFYRKDIENAASNYNSGKRP